MDDAQIPNVADLVDLRKRYEGYRNEGRIEFITFHPSYSYEEFIEGITVKLLNGSSTSDSMAYEMKGGTFKEICTRALEAACGFSPDNPPKRWKEVFDAYKRKTETEEVKFDDAPKYILIIDEINRGDIAKIFGELITLIEPDKRIGQENEILVTLPSSGDTFGVPPNLYLIGTMNTADRSIALLDVALRRRFGFVEMNPDFEVLKSAYITPNQESLKNTGVLELLNRSAEAIMKINNSICKDPTIGRDKQVGHSFFFTVNTLSELVMVWKHEILPLLEEYCYGDYSKINRLLFGKDSDTPWISQAGGIDDINEKTLGNMVSEILKIKES